MALALQPVENSRFSDLCDEPVDRLLSSVKGYKDEPLLPLTETVKPISKFFNAIEDYVYVALYNCQNPADDLNQDESASIHLYTMQFHSGPSLYSLLNQSLRAENRVELKPWFSFLKLFLTALHKLPSQTKIVYRGIKNVNLRSIYKKGTKFAWWGVSSCTTDIEVLESDQLLGKHGLRTLFSIECISGKSITNHSYFKNTEKEIILTPGSYFEVIGQLSPAPQLHIIQLKEIPSPIPQFKTTIAGENDHGNKLDQLSYPRSIVIDDDQTIYIVDYWNNRIVKWKSNITNNQIVAGGNGQGNQTNQLNHPIDIIIDRKKNSFIISDRGNRRVMQWSCQNNTKNGEIIISDVDCYGLTMDKDESLYISDAEKNEVKRWKRGEKDGKIVAGGNEKGDHLNQLDYPTYIFIDEDYSLYVSDSNNHRVIKWLKDEKEGIIVAGGNGQGNGLAQLSFPQGLIVNQIGGIYVSDWGNDRVMHWRGRAIEGAIVVSKNGYEEQSNRLIGPRGLSFDLEGNVYVVDWGNDRIQKLEIDENENNMLNVTRF